MRNFCTFMRHFQLINCRIVVHSINELKCIARGESLDPSFNPETIDEYMKELKNGSVKPLPMGAYEYSCCVEYLKMIRRELIKKRNSFKFMLLKFSKIDPHGIVCPPLEDCLQMVAKEVGYAVVCEEIKGDMYTYTLKSTLQERGR